MPSFQELQAQRNAQQATGRLGVGSSSTRPAPGADGDADASASASRTESTPLDEADTLFAADLAGTHLQVRSTPTHGRGLYATAPITAGTTILRTTPLVSVLAKPQLAMGRQRGGLYVHCTNCYLLKKVQRCAACKSVYYCSGTCQSADWPAHKPECAALKRLRGMWARTYPARAKDVDDNGWLQDEAVRALGRLCWGRKALESKRGQIEGMESHAGRMYEEEKIKLAKQIQQLRHYLGAALPSTDENVVHPVDMGDYGFKSVREVMDLVSAFHVNSFTLSTEDLSAIGVAMSAVCALFNHSCDPAAVVVFPNGGKEMCVVALRDIAQGEEVLTSYIDVSQPYAARQKDLFERYAFHCDCTLCAMDADANWVDPRWSVSHPGCKIGGRGRMPELRHEGQATVRCTCGESFTVDVPHLRSLVQEGKQILSDEGHNRLDESALPAMVNLIPKLVSLIPPSTDPLFQLLRLNARLLMPPRTPSDRESIVALLTAAAIGGKQSHPPNHPTVAIILAERAKVMAMDPEQMGPPHMPNNSGRNARSSQLLEGIKALRDAADACDRGFGGGGQVAKDMRRLGSICEREMDQLRVQHP